jgi:hypothetical protein
VKYLTPGVIHRMFVLIADKQHLCFLSPVTCSLFDGGSLFRVCPRAVALSFPP